MIKQTRN